MSRIDPPASDVGRRGLRAHLGGLFVWKGGGALRWEAVLAAGALMSAAVGGGYALDHVKAGLALALGVLIGFGGEAGEEGAGLGWLGRLAPGVLAVLLAPWLFQLGPAAYAATAVLAVALLTIGRFSRPLTVATTRFVVFLVMTGAVGEARVHGGAAGIGLTLLGMGAASLIEVGFARRRPATAAARQPAFRQRLNHWRAGLLKGETWRYPLRLGLGLALAAPLAAIWPGRGVHWFALTVVLVTPREPEIWSLRASERVLGAVAGAAGAGILLWSSPPPWGLVAVMGILAALRLVLRRGSYVLYTALTTPLVVLLSDFGQPADFTILTDRVEATFSGALAAAVAGLALAWLPKPPTTRGEA